MAKDYLQTPDGRYVVKRGELRRNTDPRLSASERRALIKQLMQARLAARDATDRGVLAAARERVSAAKHALGESGPVWWDDGAPDQSRSHPSDSSYADWWAGLSALERARGA